MNFRSIFAAALLLGSPYAYSADITREVFQPDDANSSFADIGISLVTGKLPLIGFNGQNLDESGDTINSLHIGLEGRFEYKGFFLEFIENSFSNVTLGFDAHTSDNSHHEVILTSLFDKITRDDIEGFETISDRKEDVNAGIRSSFYFDKSIVQLELVSDINDSHNGVIGALQFGHQTQFRNWNVHGLVGVRYYSESVVDHLFGVSDDEATETIATYNAKDGFMPTIQLGATLPLNEKWIFRTNAEYSRLPDSVSDSPLAQGDYTYAVQAGVYYVLYGG